MADIEENKPVAEEVIVADAVEDVAEDTSSDDLKKTEKEEEGEGVPGDENPFIHIRHLALKAIW